MMKKKGMEKYKMKVLFSFSIFRSFFFFFFNIHAEEVVCCADASM